MMLADELVGYFGDARVIVNDLLMHVEPLRPLWIPVNKHGSQCGEYLRRFDETFASDCPILTFPAGLCSRRRQGWCPICRGVRISSSGRRRPGAGSCRFSSRANYPISFYRLSNFRRKIGIRFNIEMLYLPDEMFSQKGKHFRILVGGACFDGRAWSNADRGSSGRITYAKRRILWKKKVACRSKTRINCLVFALNLTAWNPS